jgi:GPH family glycoside/pentoside/hexuronide:cation symporter
MNNSQLHSRDIDVLTLGTKIKYGFGEYVYTYSIMVFMTYFVFFLTDMVGINPAVAGTIYFIGILWDSISDPLIGFISDKTKWKSGRRRTPFMKIALLPLTILTVLLFVKVDFGGTLTVAYYLVILILYYTSTTTFYITFQSLGAEVTSDLDQRASLMTIRSGLLCLGSIIGTAGTLTLVTYIAAKLNSDTMGWIVGVGVLCVVMFILGVICINGMMPYEKIINWAEDANKHKENIFKGIGSVFKNKPFVFTLLVMLTCCVAAYGSCTILMYYMTYYAQLTEYQITMAFLLYGVVGVFTVPIASKIMQKFERKVSYCILMSSFLIAYIILFMIQSGNQTGLYIAMIFWGFGWLGLWAAIYTLIADATVVEEYLTGKEKEGTYYGIVQLGLKAGTGIMIWINGMVMANAGYVPNVAQTETSLFAIKIMNAAVPGTLIAISIVIMLFYPLNRKIYNTMLIALEYRKNNQEYFVVINGLEVGSGPIEIKEELAN